jgi:hypothetical protein
MMLVPALVLGPIVLGFAALLIPHRAELTAKVYACAVAFVVLVATIASASAPDATLRWLSRSPPRSTSAGPGSATGSRCCSRSSRSAR